LERATFSVGEPAPHVVTTGISVRVQQWEQLLHYSPFEDRLGSFPVTVAFKSQPDFIVLRDDE